LMNGHESGGEFSTVAPCVRAKLACGIKCTRNWTSGYGIEARLARSADHPAPPGRRGLAAAADALASPFAQEWRLADQTRLGLGLGVPPGAWLLVVVVHHMFCSLAHSKENRLDPSGHKAEDEDSESTQADRRAIAIRAWDLPGP
jgi:hypothetical protein